MKPNKTFQKYNICPRCGKRKLVISRRCKACLIKNPARSTGWWRK